MRFIFLLPVSLCALQFDDALTILCTELRFSNCSWPEGCREERQGGGKLCLFHENILRFGKCRFLDCGSPAASGLDRFCISHRAAVSSSNEIIIRIPSITGGDVSSLPRQSVPDSIQPTRTDPQRPEDPKKLRRRRATLLNRRPSFLASTIDTLVVISEPS